jgi:butyrate kinase
MEDSYTILTLSPGSTSTKVAVFRNTQQVFKSNVRHDPAELAQFDQAKEQLDYRIAAIKKELAANNIDLADVDAYSGYCGGMGPTVGGIFAIDDTVCDHVLNGGFNHPAILGAPILHSFAQAHGKPAFAVNQPDTDELADVARITGYPGVYRKSHVHCLNQKGMRDPLRDRNRPVLRRRERHRRPRGRRPFGCRPQPRAHDRHQ